MGVIAEAINYMRNLGDERTFAAWAGVVAGNNESAGKKKVKMPKGKSSLNDYPDTDSAGSETESSHILSQQV